MADLITNVLAVVQVATLIALIIYVIKTWHMATATRKYAEISERTLQEMKETRDEETAPYVIAYFEIPHGQRLINFVVKNVGKGFAKDIKLEFNPMLANSMDDDFSQFYLIKGGIHSMPSGYEIKTFVDMSFAYFNEEKKLPLSYNVKISFYGGINNKKRFTEQTLDLSVYKELSHVIEKNLDDLVKEIEAISKESKNVSYNLKKIRNLLDKGIWVKNPQILISELNDDPNIWKYSVIGKLNEFKTLWNSIYLKERYREINPFNEDMRNRFSNIGAQILVFISNHPPDIEIELVNSIIVIGTKIFKLGNFCKEYDVKHNRKKFENFGNEIISDITLLIEKFGDK